MERMAVDVFKDGKLNPVGQRILNYIESKSGKKSSVVPLVEDEFSTGYVNWNDPSTVNVSPGIGEAHVLAHELAHSQLKTDLAETYANNVMEYGNPFTPDKPQLINLNPKDPATLRYFYEMKHVPTMLEEANAQGVATGALDALGLGRQEIMYDSPTDYPESFGLRALDDIDRTFSPEFDGAPLGVGVFGTPQQRDEYYRIMDNIPIRVERAYRKGRELMK